LRGQLVFDEDNYLTATFARSLSGAIEDAFNTAAPQQK
jgi:hypothetical protein